MRVMLAFFALMLVVPYEAIAQQDPVSNRGTLVITTANRRENTSYTEVKVETESGEVFSCAQTVTPKTSCILTDVPAGRVKLAIQGKSDATRWIELPPGDNTIQLFHNYRGFFAVLGAVALVSSSLTLALANPLQNPTEGSNELFAFQVSGLSIGVGYLLGALFFPPEIVHLNGKRAKKSPPK
jgi:hypothetical protein